MIRGLVIILFFPLVAFSEEHWTYEPVNAEFWKSSQNLLEKKNPMAVLRRALPLEMEKSGQLEGAEGLLLAADAFYALDLNLLAYENWLEVARRFPNSSQANLALIKLSQFHGQVRHPTAELSRLVNEGRQREAPLEAGSMLAFFTALDNMQKGFQEWVDPEIKKIKAGTFWHRKLRFLVSLDMVKANQLESALGELNTLLSDPGIEPQLKRDVEWQVARIYLDLKKYDEAEAILSTFRFNERDFGRALLERAWIRYFKKDYSTALGILHGLKSSYFSFFRTAEQHLLAMLIYRKLCHYSAIRKVAEEFESQFASTFKLLALREPEKIPELLSMVLVRADVLPMADLVHRVRQQRERLKSSEFDRVREMLERYEQLLNVKDRAVAEEIERLNRVRVRSAAEDLLKAREQIRLVDYVSGLERLKVEKASAGENAAKPKDGKNYDTLYWFFDQEYWWDEINNLKVLVRDQCSGANP